MFMKNKILGYAQKTYSGRSEHRIKLSKHKTKIHRGIDLNKNSTRHNR